MIDALVLLAAEAAHGEETSKTAFYVAGGVLAGWAVLLSMIGLSRSDWPQNDGAARGVMAISAVLVAATMIASIATG
ncbi:MAG TPA: hypothetical protein VD931_19675 [Baekduia sp.]|nr:hypothetical protein [Baekduia sp.]